jgi:hypothetical protein
MLLWQNLMNEVMKLEILLGVQLSAPIHTLFYDDDVNSIDCIYY